MNFLAYAHDGPGPWILFFPLVWAAVLVAIFFLLRRTVWRGRHGPFHPGHENAPLAVLGRRYATGEIDEDEYRRRRAVLVEGHGPGPQGRDAGPKGGTA